MSRKDLAGIISDRHRHVIHAVVEEVSVAAPENSLALQLMRPTNVPAATLEHEIVSASGGKTQERVLGGKGKAIPGQSTSSKIFKPGAYQEWIEFDEVDLLKLRRLGTLGEAGITGLTGDEANWIDRASKKLKLRLRNRLCSLAWDALFTGKYTYQGIEFNFNIPGTNLLSSSTDWSVADTGKPFEDMVKLLGTNAYLRKYRNMIKALVINPKTEADIMQRAIESKAITNPNIISAGINEVRKFLAPGLPEFVVVDDVMQDESEDSDGNITVGNANFMVPDDKVLIVMDFAKGDVLFPEYGQLQLTENMNDPSASVGKPAVGIYTFVDEEGLKDRKSPKVQVVSGFNGGSNLMRSNDVFIVSV